MNKAKKYIIYAFDYDQNSGGIIALHKLCDKINQAGYIAKLWPANKPVFNRQRPFHSFKMILKYYIKLSKRPALKANPSFNTPLAGHADLTDSIAIYPEIISGNPLFAKNVVRWFLHRPGYHTGEILYGQDELYFYFSKVFDDPAINSTADNQLQVTHILTDIYKRTNYGPRTGGCYLIRKGSNRELSCHPANYVKIDGLPHEEIALLFNRCSVFISYDMHTLYSQYAALCGCTSIVIPEPGVTKTQVYPDERDCYGIAYGFDDIQNAKTQIQQLRNNLAERDRLATLSVQEFIKKTQLHFQATPITMNVIQPQNGT